MFWNIIVLFLIIAPILLGFIMDWNIDLGILPYTVTLFALSSVIHFILQLFFSSLNRLNVDSKIFDDLKNLEENQSTFAIQVSGWREDIKLFEKCLISLKNQTIKPKFITFCSDGNEEDDLYMSDIFTKIFPESCVINLEETFKDNYIKLNNYNYNHICILQPHKGKRYAMYTQSTFLLSKVDYILMIDSDTILKNNCAEILLSSIINKKADALTGDVHIYNNINLLSTLITLKYWMAFNIERSAQSYFSTVSCVAGPLAMYKSSSLSTIIENWITQTFMNKECTFGDDRHLTNLILRQGGLACYNHQAICYTDTPVTLQRFITQQTRWGKSFIREYLINFKWFNIKQLWLLYDLNFMTIYSMFLTIYIVYMMLQFNFKMIVTFNVAVLIATLIRGLYAIIITKQFKYVLFMLYGYVYIYILIPVKLWASLTLNNTNWGTGNRKFQSFEFIDIIPVLLWNLFLGICFIISFVLKIQDGFTNSDIIFSSINIVLTIGVLGLYKIKYSNLNIV
jgi:hyaluronan synthase